jgi:hypothetical protein
VGEGADQMQPFDQAEEVEDLVAWEAGKEVMEQTEGPLGVEIALEEEVVLLPTEEGVVVLPWRPDCNWPEC